MLERLVGEQGGACYTQQAWGRDNDCRVCVGGSVISESAMKGDVIEERETTIPCCSF